MTIRKYNLNLDVKDQLYAQQIITRQGDTTGTTQLNVSITDNGVPVSFTGTPQFRALTSVSKLVIVDSSNFSNVNADQGTFTYNIPSQALSEPGRLYVAYFAIADSSGIESTVGLTIYVQQAADLNPKKYGNYVSAVDRIIESTQDSITDLKQKIDDVAVPEIFTNLAEIQSKYPNGSNGIMITADNGHKYIWNGSSWSDAGVYQAVGIADDTIALPMLDDQLKSNFVSLSECTPQLSGGGGVNTADGKVTDFGTQSYWRHAQYNVSGNLKLYVSFGKASNPLVPGHIFATDDNNKILASFVDGSGEAKNIDNYEIVTPAGTTKLFVQSWIWPDLSIGMDKISVNEEKYQSLSESIKKSNFVSSGVYTPQLSGGGGVWTADGKVTYFGTQSYWRHAQYSVAGNSRLCISFGKASNPLVPGHIFATDDNNKILASFVNGSGETEYIDNYEILTPAGTTKLFVQSYLTDKISVNEEKYQSLSESIKKSKFLSIGVYTPQLSGGGGVNTADGKVTDFGTQSYWLHAQYNVSGNLKLHVSFVKASNPLVPGHIFATDDNNKILASFVNGSGETGHMNSEILTPAGTTKLFVQSYSEESTDKILVDGEKYQSSRDIDNELKICKERNNSGIYNFISRQGTLGDYPENSNKAVLNVKQNGFNSVRVSIAFTSDNVPVLIHDSSINRAARNSDGSTISSTINIADITLNQANTYDWGIAAGQNYKGMKIPLLSDFLKICSFKSIFPTLEFKPKAATDEQLKSIINMVGQYGLIDKAYFTSDVDAILLSVNKINPSINIGFITHLNSNTKVDTALKFKTEFNDVRIDMFDNDTPSIDVINYTSSKGVGIKVGSAYSLADIVKFASMGVTEMEVANVAFPATALNEYYDNL